MRFPQTNTTRNFLNTLSFVLYLIFFFNVRSSYGDDEIKWSSPEECRRPCTDDGPSLYCYYHFIVELYDAMGPACDVCSPNATNQQLAVQPQCECILGDGTDRTVLSINRMIPGPSIQVCLHDKVIIDVENGAQGIEVSIHWHGIWQYGYQYYDGVPFVTQCPIHSGETFRYQFEVANPGTHFYHSHESVHMLDGQYGSFVVRTAPKDNPHLSMYDEDNAEHVMIISDWMHELSAERIPGHYHHDLGQAAQNILINGKGKIKNAEINQENNQNLTKFTVEPNKRYRFRVINAFSTTCVSQLTVYGHTLLVIAVDGADVEPVAVDSITLDNAERVDFVLHANQSVQSYWIQVRALTECQSKQIQQLAILEYAGASEQSATEEPGYNDAPTEKILNPLDATLCDKDEEHANICINNLKSVKNDSDILYKVKPDYRLALPFRLYQYGKNFDVLFGPEEYIKFIVSPFGSPEAGMMGDILFEPMQSPPISQTDGYQTMCNSMNKPENCSDPCSCSHVYHIPKHSLVEIIMYDTNPIPIMYHPFHLHGYEYRVFRVGEFPQDHGGVTSRDLDEIIKDHEERLQNGYYYNQPGKDTLMVSPRGYTIVRFVADNPGWWLYHCHFLWHSTSGMDVLLHVGEPSDLPAVPENFPKCSSWTPSPKFPLPPK